jgi:superfamily II DNA or RNA helicase
MPKRTSKTGSELFIVDNSDVDWKVQRYLHDWCQLSKAIDVATGYFEIGGLLGLGDEWQKVDALRILMGDQVSRRTKKAFADALQLVKSRLDNSLETEKEKNDFLVGVPAIVEAIRSGRIQCKVYKKDKFHAKCYITHARQEVVGSFALVGSSNLTLPGLTENVELNVQIAGTPVAVLQEWYEEHWRDAEDVTAEVLQVIERHTREYSPFEVYLRALHEFCRGHSLTANEWEVAGAEHGGSHMYPVLDHYQKEGYHALMDIAKQFGGAFLCDGVGLGKTFIGLMAIERLVIHDHKRVALFVPKTARVDVWERELRKRLGHVGGTGAGVLSSLAVFNHTDLGLPRHEDDFQRVKELADVIIIDEAHHFRNPGRTGEDGGGPSRYRQLLDLVEAPRGKKDVILLTATPVNNSLHDFRHMAELFMGRKDDGAPDDNYFSQKLGIHSLRRHFVDMERELSRPRGMGATAAEVTAETPVVPPLETNIVEAEKVLVGDRVFRELVVQRSRAYVKRSQEQQGGRVAIFPVREDPKVAAYSVKRTYGRLLGMVEKAFQKDKPLFNLGIYYPLAYPVKKDKTVDPWVEGRQKQVCGLIRTQFLKRFESSAYAFEQSCNRLFVKLLAWVEKHSETPGERRFLEQWKTRRSALTGYVYERQRMLWGDEDEGEAEEDLITEEMLEQVDHLDRGTYDVPAILRDTLGDLDQLAEFLDELRKFESKHDDKLKALIKLLTTDKVLKRHKLLIFSEFADTARYLHCKLVEAGIKGVEQIDSGSKKSRGTVIRCFAPYYNGACSAELADRGETEIRVLISTDVLSEGLNLQDATRMINYDLHWNPVRLMQRIGRVDRRLNPAVEDRLIADHPDEKLLRGQISFWNFLPPEELNELLTLYKRVTQKTLQISKSFGIEGRKLLKPDDDYEALREFNEGYEGQTTVEEGMRLELQRLLDADPGLAKRIAALPGRVFSGKEHVSPDTRAAFFCYRLPRPASAEGKPDDSMPWTEEAGETRWYLYVLDKQAILEEPADIVAAIRCTSDTPRRCLIEPATLSEIRGKVEKHIKNTFLKAMQAPIGVKPVLKAWMELN